MLGRVFCSSDSVSKSTRSIQTSGLHGQRMLMRVCRTLKVRAWFCQQRKRKLIKDFGIDVQYNKMRPYYNGYAGNGPYQSLKKLVPHLLRRRLGFDWMFYLSRTIISVRYYRHGESAPFAQYYNMQNDTQIEQLVHSLSSLNEPILSLSPSVASQTRYLNVT